MFSPFTGRSLRIATAAGAIAIAAAGCSSASGSGAFKPAGGSTTPAHSQGGGGSATLTALDAVHMAAQKATKMKSFAATFSMKISGAANMKMAGTMQGKVHPVELYANLPHLRIAGQNVSMAEIITSKAFYMKIPQLAQQTGKPWAEVKLSALKSGTGASISAMMQQVGNQSPGSQARVLLGASHAKVVGHSTINGVPVTEYSGSYPFAKALSKLPASLRSEAAQSGFKSVSFKVWLDSGYQVHKMAITEKGSMANMTMTMALSSINQPVHIPFPSASQVTNIPASALNR